MHRCVWLISFMLFPAISAAADRARNAFRAQAGALLIPTAMDILAKPGTDAAANESRAIRFFMTPSGGWGALAGAAGVDYQRMFDERLPDVITVGKIFCVLRTIAEHHADKLEGGASLGKARDFFVKRDRDDVIGIAQSSNTLDKAWSELKPVAHLCAALTYMRNAGITWADDLAGMSPEKAHFYEITAQQRAQEKLDLFLRLAANFEVFGVDFRSRGYMAPLLDSDAIWSVGTDPHPETLSFPPLDGDLWDRMRKRRATSGGRVKD